LSSDLWSKCEGHKKTVETEPLARSYGELSFYLIVSKVSKQMVRAFTELIPENDVEGV